MTLTAYTLAKRRILAHSICLRAHSSNNGTADPSFNEFRKKQHDVQLRSDLERFSEPLLVNNALLQFYGILTGECCSHCH
jgi:hypothetical protein